MDEINRKSYYKIDSYELQKYVMNGYVLLLSQIFDISEPGWGIPINTYTCICLNITCNKHNPR